MILKERISASEKYEVLSTLSPNPILIVSGFLGGLILALLLSPLVIKGIPLIPGMNGGQVKEVVIGLVAVITIMGMIAAKLLQWEYNVNREAYKREGEFHIPLVYPFFFLCLLGIFIVLWLPGTSNLVWAKVMILVMSAAILGSALIVIWRFFHIVWLSILSPVDWRAVIETRHFNHQLKMSFAEVKRYPSPLSLTIMDINHPEQLKGRAMRKIQEELINIVDKNVRETDAVGRIEGGKVVVTMAHTERGGALILARRIKKILEDYLKSLKDKGKGITLSIGIASYASSDMKSHEDLLKKAQLALTRAKEEGGDRICAE